MVEGATIEQSTAQELNVAQLLSKDVTPSQWINERLATFSIPSLRADQKEVTKFLHHIDNLSWQLEQLELRKNVEFETAARKYTSKELPLVRAQMRELRISCNLDNIPPLEMFERQLNEAESTLASFNDSLRGERIEKIRALQKRKEELCIFIEQLEMEIEWRKRINEMETAMSKGDIDIAQEKLEELENLSTSKTSSTSLTTRLNQVETLRMRLVDIIRNM